MIGRKRFELADLRRVPIHLSSVAQEIVMQSSDEGRKFPSALSEVLGAQQRIISVRVDLMPMYQHFPHHPEPQAPLLEIVAQHADGTPEHRWFLAASTLTEQPRGPHHLGFRALRGAQDLLHTYPYKSKE